MAQPTERESSPTLRASRAQDTRDALTELGRQQASKRRMPKLLRSLFSNKLATMSVFILLVMIFVAIFAPVLTNDDPRIGQIIESKRPPMWAEGGSSDFPLGTDPLGRDVLTRILYGARISLIVGFASVFIAGVIGIFLGLLSGFYGGKVDDIIMRFADIQLAVPFILLAIAILAVLGQGLDKIIITLGISGWVTYGRVVRGSVLSWRETEFVEAARAIGAVRATGAGPTRGAAREIRAARGFIRAPPGRGPSGCRWGRAGPAPGAGR